MYARQAIYNWAMPLAQSRVFGEKKKSKAGRSLPGGARLTVLKICKPSWPPDTYILPSKIVTPAALRFELIGVTTVHLQKTAETGGRMRVSVHGLPRQLSRAQAAASSPLPPPMQAALLLRLSPSQSPRAGKTSTFQTRPTHTSAMALHL